MELDLLYLITVVPAILVFLIVLFWENINDFILKKFKVKINYIFAIIIGFIIFVILTLLYF